MLSSRPYTRPDLGQPVPPGIVANSVNLFGQGYRAELAACSNEFPAFLGQAYHVSSPSGEIYSVLPSVGLCNCKWGGRGKRQCKHIIGLPALLEAQQAAAAPPTPRPYTSEIDEEGVFVRFAPSSSFADADSESEGQFQDEFEAEAWLIGQALQAEFAESNQAFQSEPQPAGFVCAI